MPGRLNQLPERPVPQIEFAPSVELRRRFLEEYFRPLIERMFEKEPRLDGVMLCFAQYWNDNAGDAVHHWIVPLVDRSLTLNEAVTLRNAPFTFTYKTSLGAETVTGVTYPPRPEKDAEEELFGRYASGVWVNNLYITAFASFTREGSNQEMDWQDAYLPYALFVREPNGIDCRFVGEMLRPHLEDQPSEWMRRDDAFMQG